MRERHIPRAPAPARAVLTALTALTPTTEAEAARYLLAGRRQEQILARLRVLKAAAARLTARRPQPGAGPFYDRSNAGALRRWEKARRQGAADRSCSTSPITRPSTPAA